MLRRVGSAGPFGRGHAVVAAAAIAAGAVFGLTPRSAHAQKPTSQTTEYSAYEKETIAGALAQTGYKIDPAPEGKVIESIETVRLEVFEPRDPVPEQIIGIKTRKIANSLHYVSRDFVIRREMLLAVGEQYQQVIVDETARNMRSRMPLQVSIVIIVPVQTATPGVVKLLVITKDIWSLRLSFDLAVTPGGVEKFLLVPQETNVLGWQHTIRTSMLYQPETYTFGVGYAVPRFGKTWIGAGLGASVTVNRRSGEAEGSGLSLSVGQGLYSTRTPWAWGAEAAYAVGVARRYVNAEVLPFNSQVTPNILDNIPTEYKSRSAAASVSVTRSYGWGIKNNFGLSMNVSSAEYETFDLSRFDPRAAADFRRQFLPVGETRVYPALSWATFSNDFLRTLDVNTLALQEDFRLGHTFSTSVYPVRTAFGSTRDLVGVSVSGGYSIALGDGLAAASFSTFAENMENQLSDASVSAGATVVTPRLGFGRIVMNTSFINRYRNYLNSRTITGGDDRLRGYPSNIFFGKDAAFYNLEFRSTSVEILKCALGGVAFFDSGDAASSFEDLKPGAKQSVGFGLRALFPQVNRLVFRADLAFPLKRGPFPETGVPTRLDPVGFFFSFGQAFGP